MLAQTVTTNTVIGAGRVWNGIPTACHFATVFWLFRDEFGRIPTPAELVRVGDATLAVGRMLAHGSRKTNPLHGSLTLTAGSILVFVRNNQAGHSCVAIAPQTLGGFNQLSWYSAGGANHAYSAHPTNELMWGSLTHRSQVHRVGAEDWYDLYEVPEQRAKAVLRSLVQ